MIPLRIGQRQRVPAPRIADKDNGETPSIAHEKALAAQPVHELIRRIATLSSQLPLTVLEAAEPGDIHRFLCSAPKAPKRTPAPKPAPAPTSAPAPNPAPPTGNRRFLPADWEARKEVYFNAAFIPGSDEGGVAAQPIIHNVDTDEEDSDYKGGKQRQVSEEDEDDDLGVQAASETAETGRKRKAIVIDGNLPASDKTRKRRKKKKKSADADSSQAPKINVVEIPSSSEEDIGLVAGRRGPKSTSRAHFSLPKPVNVNGKRRWAWQCLHCSHTLTVPRTLSTTSKFEDEPKQPLLGNLATHLRDKHGGPNIPVPIQTSENSVRGETAASAKLMEDFLREGELRPGKTPTQVGFYKVFAA
ncbi:hypothetical protein MIND_01115200 [Mycena indigotica]|uniref:Uncharacterized protein n=1 Tax=Mycena indigotica TaxID=2126181 RepID=A0A8H6S5Y5_9AGAR|nr:uncharacterized protein MIND_01115200 [Mycena indigotica]KAF7293383.1 hypothetical protein MIND_01115200 [Mycena indigotica]